MRKKRPGNERKGWKKRNEYRHPIPSHPIPFLIDPTSPSPSFPSNNNKSPPFFSTLAGITASTIFAHEKTGWENPLFTFITLYGAVQFSSVLKSRSLKKTRIRIGYTTHLAYLDLSQSKERKGRQASVERQR